MLLRENFQLLLSLDLSQTIFSLAKDVVRNSERLSRFKQQLHFLRMCKYYDIFPSTILNIHLPQAMDRHICQIAIKRFILNKLIKRIQNLIQCEISAGNALNDRISQLIQHDTKFKIRKLRYNSYGSSSNHHCRKLENRFNWLHLRQKGCPPPWVQDNRQQNPVLESRVTDLSNTLSPEEIRILSRGPKFRITDSLNTQTLLDLRTSLYRFSYQYRWKQALPNQREDELVYPKSYRVNYPPAPL
jgi:hypothetical protein